jgi:putative methionine-R-sulfoxide reductase with GAF domain
MPGSVGSAVDVLIVALEGHDDDHERLLSTVVDGFRVERTDDVTAAVDVLAANTVGCVVVSGTSPAVGDAVERTKAAAGTTRVFAAVDGADDDVAAIALEAGVDDLLPTDRGAATERVARTRVADVVESRLGERRERSLRTLNTVATELKTAETPAEAGQRTVDAAADVLDIEFCGVCLIEDDFLEAVAISDGLDDVDTMRMRVDEGVAGLTYRERRSFLVDELDDFDEADPKGEFHSLISVPVGEHGVFQAVGDDPGTFDETDLELVELLAGHCRSTLDRIEREARLREQNERLDEFASVVSHDLRNPLTLMQAELEMAEETGEPEDFERVRDAITRMDDLIDDLLSLAKAGTGTATLEPVSVEAATAACWATMSATTASVDVRDAPTVDADPTRFRQLLENLFRNAIEHGGEDVTVTVGALPTADADEGDDEAGEDGRDGSGDEGDDGGDSTVAASDGSGDDAGFYVADDGPGIPPDDRETVFESGYTTSRTGTGFGLRIVQDVADAHGWTVTVSESDAGGARFEIRT